MKTTTQSRKQSLVETAVNTAVGFLLSIALWKFIVDPILGVHTSLLANLWVTSLFTIVSMIRGYLCRRFFNGLAEVRAFLTSLGDLSGSV